MNTDWGMFSLFVVSVGGCFATGWLLNRIEKIKNERKWKNVQQSK